MENINEELIKQALDIVDNDVKDDSDIDIPSLETDTDYESSKDDSKKEDNDSSYYSDSSLSDEESDEEPIHEGFPQIQPASGVSYPFGCEHYYRLCKLKMYCCNTYYWCRLCHDKEKHDMEPDYNKKHKVDRKKVTEVKCMNCGEEQEVSQKCRKCDKLFGSYFCEICKLYDFNNKGQWHCLDCEICRVGGKDNFVHCNTCKSCQPSGHQCCEVDKTCPICWDDLFDSTQTWQTMKCGHPIHTKCFQLQLANGNVKCPMCSKYAVDSASIDGIIHLEVESNPTPDEYKDTMVDIICNECTTKSNTNLHLVAIRCPSCLSYNTKQIK